LTVFETVVKAAPSALFPTAVLRAATPVVELLTVLDTVVKAAPSALFPTAVLRAATPVFGSLTVVITVVSPANTLGVMETDAIFASICALEYVSVKFVMLAISIYYYDS
jgi:hypothetical protein